MEWMHGGEGAFGASTGTTLYYVSWSKRHNRWRWDTWDGVRLVAR